MWGYDDNGRPVIVQLTRRRAGPDAGSRLRRYAEHVAADDPRIPVAPSLTERAEQLLQEFGLESRQVAPPTDGGEQDCSLAEFFLGETAE